MIFSSLVFLSITAVVVNASTQQFTSTNDKKVYRGHSTLPTPRHGGPGKKISSLHLLHSSSTTSSNNQNHNAPSSSANNNKPSTTGSTTASTTCQNYYGAMSYYGGPVLNNVNVTPLLWGPNVVNATGITSFYKGIVNSNYIDWLSECK
jgi:hypothetical protein